MVNNVTEVAISMETFVRQPGFLHGVTSVYNQDPFVSHDDHYFNVAYEYGRLVGTYAKSQAIKFNDLYRTNHRYCELTIVIIIYDMKQQGAWFRDAHVVHNTKESFDGP